MQSIVPEEAAREVAHEIATLQCVQFTDLQEHVNAFQRRYTRDIVRVQEVERRLAVLETHLTARNIKFARRVENVAAATAIFRNENTIDTIEAAVERFHAEVTEAARVLDELQKNLSTAKEFELVLNETGRLLQSRGASGFFSRTNSSFLDPRTP